MSLIVGNTGTVTEWTDMLLCMDCVEKEKAVLAEHQSPENQEKRMKEHNAKLVEHARSIDASLRSVNDIHNAKTIATMEVFEAIDNNPTVTNKLYMKCQFLSERFHTLTKVIFEARNTLKDANEEIGLIQIELNKLANGLRLEEREKLQINNINYQPVPPKSIKPKTAVKAKKAESKGPSMSDIRFMAAKYKVPADIVSLTARARNCSAEEAAKIVAGNAGVN